MKVTLPSHYDNIRKEFPEVFKAHEKLGEVTSKGPLSKKQSHLIKLAASAAIRSEGAVHSHARQALAAGLKPTEIRHAIIMLTSTIGFPTMMAALSWVDDVLDKSM